jgi:hypothetical protein
VTGPNDEWPILADPNPDDEEWPLQPNIDPGPAPTELSLENQEQGGLRLRCSIPLQQDRPFVPPLWTGRPWPDGCPNGEG